MKLVWIAQDLHIGGGQRVICALSEKLAQRGHEVIILFPRGRAGFKLPFGVSSLSFGFSIGSPLASLVVNFPAMIAAVPPCDWILCSMPISAFAGYLAGQWRKTRVLSYVMNDERALFDDRSLLDSEILLGCYHSLADFSHRLPLAFAVNSRWTGTRVLHGRGGNYPIIPHGVDLSIFKPEGPRLQKTADFAIACVGRRHRWKGLADLILALNRIKFKPASALDFELWVITQDDLDLSQAQFLYRIIKPQTDREIAAALRSADVLAHPSWFEGFGLPPLEAMACGTPCLITDSGGVSEFARQDENCIMVPPRDSAALAFGLEKLLVDEALRNRLSAAGLETASRFTWDHAADALEAILMKPR